MKRFVIVMLLGLCFVQYLIQPHAYAAQMFSDRQTQGQADMRRTLDGESRMVLDAISDGEDLTQSISRILRQTKQQQRGAIAEAVAALTGAAAVMLLCSCAEAFSKTSRISPLILQLAGALGMTAAVYQTLAGLTSLCRETTEQIQIFSKSMLPVMTTAIGLSGSPASATLVYSGTMFALDLCISLITGVYIPAVSAYVAILTVNTAIGNDMLKRLAACVKWLITGSLRLLLTLFFFYITISGSVSHGMDAGTVKAAKFALNSSVPLVGNILSGATDSVLAGAVVLKNSLGVFGMLCICAICLVPFLRIGVNYLVFKIGAAVLSPICPKLLSGLADGIADSIGMIFGMLGSCSAILFFELVYSVVMVT